MRDPTARRGKTVTGSSKAWLNLLCSRLRLVRAIARLGGMLEEYLAEKNDGENEFGPADPVAPVPGLYGCPFTAPKG